MYVCNLWNAVKDSKVQLQDVLFTYNPSNIIVSHLRKKQISFLICYLFSRSVIQFIFAKRDLYRAQPLSQVSLSMYINRSLRDYIKTWYSIFFPTWLSIEILCLSHYIKKNLDMLRQNLRFFLISQNNFLCNCEFFISTNVEKEYIITVICKHLEWSYNNNYVKLFEKYTGQDGRLRLYTWIDIDFIK